MRLPGKSTPSFGDLGLEFDEFFDDFEGLARLEARSLRGVFRGRSVTTVLDCAVGTGLQALGLARMGYRVAASDVSRNLVHIVAEKAAIAGVAIELRRDDFRTLRAWRGRLFDAIILAGNSLPLLHDRKEIGQSLRAVRSVLRPGGIAVVGVRDYGVARDLGNVVLPRRIVSRDGQPEWILDLRLFGSRRVRVTSLFLSSVATRRGVRWKQRAYTKSYMYVSASETCRALADAGFADVRAVDLFSLRPYTGGEWFLACGGA